LDQTFYGQLCPISEKFVPGPLAVSGHTREETRCFGDPKKVMEDSKDWIKLYKGTVKDMFKNFKHLRKTPHTHHPVDDAKGNAGAFLTLKKEYELKVKL